MINSSMRLRPLATCMAAALMLSSCDQQTDANAEFAKQIEALTSDYGYIRLVPPSVEFTPGMLVHKVNYVPSDGRPKKVNLGRLCSAKYSTDRYDGEVITSPSAATEIKRNLKGSFALTGPEISQFLGLSATGNVAENAVLEVKDIEIASYSAEDLRNIRNLLGDICRDIVNANIETNNAFQITRVLKASISITVTFKRGASASMVAEALAELSKLGLSVSSEGQAQTKGHALVYGIDWEEIRSRV